MATVAVQKENENEESGKRFDEIQQRAYELFEQRGCEDGRDLEDWLKAEQEILGLPPS